MTITVNLLCLNIFMPSLRQINISILGKKNFKGINVIICSSIFPYLTLPYKDQKQTKVDYPMLNNKFQGHQRRRFPKVLPYMRVAAMLVM